jgi:K+-sensing histidine kinase KdpD
MRLPARMRDVLKRYGLAFALASLALLIRAALPVPEGTTIYQLPIVAVVLSGWFGGRGPGLFASLICATVILYRFVPPAHSFELPPDYALGFFIFIALCLLLSEFSAGRRRAEHARRASEERFRALVQFSFDVYWESDAEHRRVQNAMFAALQQILRIDSLACQLAALHGLGHLRHPETESAITKYLERNPDLSEENRKFALACITGEIE